MRVMFLFNVPPAICPVKAPQREWAYLEDKQTALINCHATEQHGFERHGSIFMQFFPITTVQCSTCIFLMIFLKPFS